MPEKPLVLPIIYLIGFMGAGKTTYGKAAAKKAGWKFKDLDTLIEEQEGAPIPNIFQTKGEEYFRAAERKALESTIEFSSGPFLIACGGGTPCYHDNMEWMNAHGITVYLNTPREILTGRLRQMRAYRPMLNNIAEEELGNFIQELFDRRNPYYLKAQYILEGESLNEKSLTQLLKTIHPGDYTGFGKIPQET